jgi:thiol-disulfide isomerase/thioredoxin
MRKLLAFLILMWCMSAVIAQTENEAPYKRFPTVPPFTLLKVDSTVITKEMLASKKPTLIMYFNPGCEHCQHQMEAIIEHKDEFKNIQIVMATYAPMNELSDFIEKYKLTELPNISLGRDTKYMLQPFYKIGGLPYQALYDANGNLLTTFEGNVAIDNVLTAFKKKD